MTAESDPPAALPPSLAEVLEQHDPETVVAVRTYCERLLEEYELSEEFEERTF